MSYAPQGSGLAAHAVATAAHGVTQIDGVTERNAAITTHAGLLATHGRTNLDGVTERDAAVATHAALATHIPSGTIRLWAGTIANIPSGFVICDGNNSTPNLLTKFVQGVATAATNPGATGGAATVTLAASEMPSHTHYQASSSGAGANPVSPATENQAALNIEPTGSTGGGGAHQNEPTFYDVAFIMKT